MGPIRRSTKHTPVLVQASLQRLGQRIAQARKLRELTQEQLAHLSDVSVSTVRSMEDGADGIAVGNALKVLKGLDLLDQIDALLDPQRDPEAVAYAIRKTGGDV